MHHPQIISFPQLGNYHIPITTLLKQLFPKDEILPPLPTTKRTIELGSRHSPDFVCVPFKYNLGNYIESLERGATLLAQCGGGCRYGYYGEIQQTILADLGYEFDFLSLARENARLPAAYRHFRKHGSTASFPTFLSSLYLVSSIIRVMDEIERFVRERVGFERHPGMLAVVQESFLAKLPFIHSHKMLHQHYTSTKKALANIPIDLPDHLLRVGIVGELYSSMEPCSNFFLEKELAAHGMFVNRYMNLSFLLFQKHKKIPQMQKEAGRYLRYDIGAEGTGSIAHAHKLVQQHYDGIIHVKPFGCTPEINAMPMLQNISADYGVPILYFSFDSQTSETGVKTRIEAFADMIKMAALKNPHAQGRTISAS